MEVSRTALSGDSSSASVTARVASPPWQRWDVVAAVLCFGFFAFAVYFRQRWVGGCDCWSYYAEAQKLLGRVIPALAPYPDVPEPRAQTPLCFEIVGGKPASFFMPGFSMILALAGLVHAEFLVNPVLGALTGWMLYLIARPRSVPAALFGMSIWLSNLLTFWGSTQLMSDLPAAAVLTLSCLLATRSSPLIAGAVAGFSLAIRPANLLFCIVLPWFCRTGRERWRVGAGVAAAVAALVLFHVARFGVVRPPYFANASVLGVSAVGFNLRFFAVEMTRLLWIALPFAAIAVVRAPRWSAPYVAWIAGFVAFYVHWMYPFEVWWRTRFLLPAVPALILLAAEGARITADAARRLKLGPLLPGLASVLLVVFAVTSFRREAAAAWVHTDSERHYYLDALRTKAIVEPDALIGARDHTGPLRLYANLRTFSWDRVGAFTILEWAYNQKRPVYLLFDDEEARESPNAGRLGDRFRLQLVETLPSGKPLFSVHEHRHPTVVLEIGTPAARPHLVSGWAGDELDGEIPFVWAMGHEAIVRAPLKAGKAYRMRVIVASFRDLSEPQVLSIEAAGEKLASIVLDPDPTEYTVQMPAAPQDGLLKFRFSTTRSPEEANASEDKRLLAALFQRIAFQLVDDEPQH